MTDRLEEKILNRTKAPSLHHVKNLNCWGWRISDLSIMKRMPNLRVLNLSVNEITTLQHLQDCHQLVELYLRRNLISDLSELRHLQNLKYLRVIWLTNNPCTHEENYRDKVYQILPQLEKLDNQRISKGDDNDDEGSSKTLSKSKRTSGRHNSRNNSKTGKFSNTGTSMLSSKQSQNSTSDNNVLAAVLCLLKELNPEDLETVILKAQEQIDTFDSEEIHGSDNLDVIDEMV